MHAHKPVIIACSSNEPEQRTLSKVKQAGFDDYYVCPITVDQLPKIFEKVEKR